MKWLIILVYCLFLIASDLAQAKGIASWLGDRVGVNLSPLDDLHREIKNNLPIYKQVEESISGSVRKVATEINGEIAGQIAYQWARHSRDELVRSGRLKPLPEGLKSILYKHFDRQLVDKTRYAVNGHGWFNLANGALGDIGNRDAIVLIDVIILRSEHLIFQSWLMAHEFQHIKQVADRGPESFFKNYVKNYNRVEQEANEVANRIAPFTTNAYGEIEFTSKLAKDLVDKSTGEPITFANDSIPTNASFACELQTDKSQFLFQPNGKAYPTGYATVPTRNLMHQCYAMVHGLSPDPLCISQNNGMLVDRSDRLAGSCVFLENGFFLQQRTRYFGSFMYDVTVNGRQAGSQHVSVSRGYYDKNGNEFFKYDYSSPNGRYYYYFSEDTGSSLYMYFGDEWLSDEGNLRIIDFWGSRSFETKWVKSDFIDEKTKQTRLGSIKCFHYKIMFKYKQKGNYTPNMETCITPGIGEIWRKVKYQDHSSVEFLLASAN